jgi:hypothetical protein
MRKLLVIIAIAFATMLSGCSKKKEYPYISCAQDNVCQLLCKNDPDCASTVGTGGVANGTGGVTVDIGDLGGDSSAVGRVDSEVNATDDSSNSSGSGGTGGSDADQPSENSDLIEFPGYGVSNCAASCYEINATCVNRCQGYEEGSVAGVAYYLARVGSFTTDMPDNIQDCEENIPLTVSGASLTRLTCCCLHDNNAGSGSAGRSNLDGGGGISGTGGGGLSGSGGAGGADGTGGTTADAGIQGPCESYVPVGAGEECDNTGDCNTCLCCALAGPCQSEYRACYADEDDCDGLFAVCFDETKDCGAYLQCISNCFDKTCDNNCISSYPEGRQGYEDLFLCANCGVCLNDCGASSDC